MVRARPARAHDDEPEMRLLAANDDAPSRGRWEVSV
jgi:hypothetical protein